jgi:hypothetical protein
MVPNVVGRELYTRGSAGSVTDGRTSFSPGTAF